MDRRKFFGVYATGAAGVMTGSLISSPNIAHAVSTTSDVPVLASTLAVAKTENVTVGSVYIFSDRADGIFDVVDGVTGANGYNIVEHENLDVKFVLRTDVVVNVQQFGAKGDNVTDDTAAINAAIDLAKGREVYVPEGRYLITDTLGRGTEDTYGAFGPGLKIIGAGALATIFRSEVSGTGVQGDVNERKATIRIDGPDRQAGADCEPQCEDGEYKAAWGSVLREFSIEGNPGRSNAVGIKITNGYEVIIEHLYITSMSTHGIELQNGVFRDDGWNMVSIRSCWVESCRGWGIKADGSPERNEGSYTYLENVFFQTNGVQEDFVPPASGGMIWKGQILTMEQCAFANGNENVGLYIKGDAGLGQSVDLRSTTFENCHRRGLYCTGVLVFKGRNLQFYNNDDYTAVSMCEFDCGQNYVLRHIDIDGVTIRATAGNHLTAFRIAGLYADLANCSVKNVNWENFYPHQIAYDGFKDKPSVIANATTSVPVYASDSLISFDTVKADIQNTMEPSPTADSSGRFRLYYKALYAIKGKISIKDLPANTSFRIVLFNTSLNTIEQVLYQGTNGLSTQTFDFDFSGEYGDDFVTRTFEIRASHALSGVFYADNSHASLNTLSIERIVQQDPVRYTVQP